MIGRTPRKLSQRNYQSIAALHAEADRLRQIDAGLTYRRNAVTPGRQVTDERPLHIGPEIEAVPTGKGDWAA